MKLRFIALAICAVLIMTLTACDGTTTPATPAEKPTTSVQTETVPLEVEGYDRVDMSVVEFSNPLYNSVQLTKGYESLTSEKEKKCYELIDQYAGYISEEPKDGFYTIYPVTLYGDVLSEAQLHLVISAYSMDHPQVFWLESSFAYYSTNTLTYLQLNSGLSASEIEQEARAMRKNINDIFSGMPENLRMYDRELYLHDEFAQRCTYADTSDVQTDKFRVYTSLGGLVDYNAVCEGYSRAMQVLLSLSGIETYYVSGVGNEDLHMWNCVNIDGDWYYLDVTWDDNDNGETDYDHFNITTQQLLIDHTISPLFWELSEDEICGGDTNVAVNFNMFIPECDNTSGAFYSQNTVDVTGFDDENLDRIASRMVSAAYGAEEAVYLYIDPDYLDFDYAVDNLFYSGDYAIFTCVSRANEQLTGVQIKENYVSTTESPEFYVVTVYLEYE